MVTSVNGNTISIDLGNDTIKMINDLDLDKESDRVWLVQIPDVTSDKILIMRYDKNNGMIHLRFAYDHNLRLPLKPNMRYKFLVSMPGLRQIRDIDYNVGKDLPGSGNKVFFGECMRRCANNPKCVGFVSSHPNHCWMKEKPLASQNRPGVISYHFDV